MPSLICDHGRGSTGPSFGCFQCRSVRTRVHYHLSNSTVDTSSEDERPRLFEPVEDAVQNDSVEMQHIRASDDQISTTGSENTTGRERQCIRIQAADRCFGRGIWKFWGPAVLVTITMLPGSIMLVYILIFERLKTSAAPFPELARQQQPPSSTFIYLTYSVARILFFTGLNATLARLLTGLLMCLYTFTVVGRLLNLTSVPATPYLPTAREHGHLLAMLSGSAQKLSMFFWYGGRKKGRAPSVLRRTAALSAIATLLLTSLTAADIAAHYTATSVQISQPVEVVSVGSWSFELSEVCQDLNRADNMYMPCSYNLQLYYSDKAKFIAQQKEIIDLSHNISKRAEVRLVQDPQAKESKLAVLLPRSESLSSTLQFRARTVAVHTESRLITDTCNFRQSKLGTNYWDFNCSESFWGVLGKQPGTPSQPLTADQSALTYKATDSLLFAFFTEGQLQVPYNTQGFNMTDEAMPSTPIGIPDEELINPVHVGFAFRAPLTTGNPDANFSKTPGFFVNHATDNPQWWGFALACQYEVVELEYTWANGSLLDKTIIPIQNGRLAEIYHGYHSPNQAKQLDINLQDAMVQATMQDSVDGLLERWSELYSAQVMSVIGAFHDPARSIAEQMLQTTLVAQVAIPPLVLAIAGGFAYSVLGFYVVLSAWVATYHCDIREAAGFMTVEGVAMQALPPCRGVAEDASSDQAAEQCGIEKDEHRYGIVHRTGELQWKRFCQRPQSSLERQHSSD